MHFGGQDNNNNAAQIWMALRFLGAVATETSSLQVPPEPTDQLLNAAAFIQASGEYSTLFLIVFKWKNLGGVMT